MMKKNSLGFRMFVAIFINIVICFSVVFGVIYFFVSKMTVEDIEDIGRRDVHLVANSIDMVLQNVQDTADTVADIVETDIHNEQFVLNILKTMVEKNKNIYGGTISFEPYAFDKEQKFFAPYFYKKDKKIEFMFIGKEAYDYLKWEWYTVPKEKNKALWIDPYFDEGAGNILMATYSVPFYRKEKGTEIFTGVVTADVSLDWLKKLVLSVGSDQTDGVVLVGKKDGVIVAQKNRPTIGEKTIFDIEKERNSKAFSKTVQDLIAGKTDFIRSVNPFTNEKEWVSYSSLATINLAVCMFYPEKVIMAPLYKLHVLILLIAFLGGIVIIFSISSIAKSIISPLHELVKTTYAIAKGDLDAEVPHRKIKDEIEYLADSFENMKLSLKDYIVKLTETTAREQKIASELSVAHDIQMSIVPKIFPPFGDDKRVDIYASLNSAREVGGDFYDFFRIDDDRICFVIGDVSGKGVPAALFMAVSKTLIKATAIAIDDPGDIMGKVNKELAVENDKFLFVTVFLGILNIKTGELIFSNAGHDNPFLICNNSKVKTLEAIGGMVIGIDASKNFDSGKIMLTKGDKIFLSTDGVSEAMNSKNEMFGIEKIETQLDQFGKLPIKEIIVKMNDKIQDFVGEASQYDDITMMCIEYVGS